MVTPHGYGRTRRPKELWNDDSVGTKQTGTTVLPVRSVHLANDLDSTDAGKNGYSTENQRYLHIQLTGDDDDSYTATVYGYNYAFGAWSPLYVKGKGTATTANDSMKRADYATIDDASGGPKQFTIEIAGIDRIALVHGSGEAGKITARMACSTF